MIDELTEEERRVLEKNGGLKLAADHCSYEAKRIESDIAVLLRMPEMTRDLRDVGLLVSRAMEFYQLAVSFYTIVIEDLTSNMPHSHPVKNGLLNDSFSQIHIIKTKLVSFSQYK